MKKISLIILAGLLLGMISGCGKEEKKPLSGYKFDNKKGVIKVEQTNDFIDDLTIDMHIMMHEYPKSWTSIVAKFSTDNDNEFSLRIKNKDEAQWYYGNGTKAYVLRWNPSEVLPLNTWVRLTAIRDRKAKTLTLLADGKVVETKKFAAMPQASASKASIVLMSRASFFLKATLSDLKIWNSVLTTKDLEKNTVIAEPQNQRDLVGYWQFDGIKKEIFLDLSRAKRDGEISKVK